MQTHNLSGLPAEASAQAGLNSAIRNYKLEIGLTPPPAKLNNIRRLFFIQCKYEIVEKVQQSHPERSEGSQNVHREILRYAQNDTVVPMDIEVQRSHLNILQ